MRNAHPQVRHERLHVGSTGAGAAEAAEEWPFACAHCQEPCVSRQTLELHLRRHSGRKAHRNRREEQDQDQESLEDQEEHLERLRKKKKLRKRNHPKEGHANEATKQPKERQQDQECQDGELDPEQCPLEEWQHKLELEDPQDPEWQHKLEQDAEPHDDPRMELSEEHFHDLKSSTSKAL